MLSVSQAYRDVQARRSGKRARITVKYKRRYFDANAVAFVYEAQWRTLSMSDIVDPGEIVQQLDTAQPQVFKSSTVTLRLRNTDNRWVRSVNDPSIFAADAVAPNGYYDDYTLFQILDGHQLDDGTWEDVPQFTGYAFEITPLPKAGYAEIVVSASLLADKCAATKINAAVTGESMALSVEDEPLSPSPGDGTTAKLKTQSTGVISVHDVKANGTPLVLTTDYTVSIPIDGTAATITLVTPATWNGQALTWSGVTKDLLTTSQAVASVSKVYANGVAMTQGTDYLVSLPSALGPAQITLQDPTLWIGKTFTWDGTKGVTAKKIEEAIALYCDAAGIGSGARDIQPVILPGALSATKTITSQSDWAAYSAASNISTDAIPGSLIQEWSLLDDFSDGNYTANPAWTVQKNSGSVSITGTSPKFLRLVANNSSENATKVRVPMAVSAGTWSWVSSVSINAATGFAAYVAFASQATGVFTNGLPASGYALMWDVGTRLSLVKFDTVSPYQHTLASATVSGSQSQHTWNVTLDASGNLKVYMDGSLKLSATDTTYARSTYFAVAVDGSNVFSCSISITQIYFTQAIDGFNAPVAGGVGDAEYVFDLGATPVSLGVLIHNDILNGGTILYRTATAPDSGGSPGTFEALQALGPGDQMMSTPQRWLKIRPDITSATRTFVSPVILRIVANYSTTVVTLAQVAPTSGTAWSEIQKYASICNYDTGWDESGTFFFRSKAVAGDAVLVLDPWTNLIDVDDTHPGWDRVYNIGHASAPPYEYYYDKTDAGEAEPTSERRFGANQLDIDLSGVLIANDVAIGKAAAQNGYQDYVLPKWRCRAPIKYTAQLQLADPVALTWVPDPKMLENVAGDPLQAPGAAGPVGVALAIQKKMKVVGITRQPKARVMQLLLEEILS